MQWTFCNTTAEEQEISEIPLSVHTSLNFHQLAILISASCALASFMLSFWLMWMHAMHYTKPSEQRHIIRILLMVPIYAASNFLQLAFYHHSVYYAVIADCYEAFAISAFFSLMCNYIAPGLHDQKQFFRQMKPIQPWVLPLNWFKAMCGGERGPWRTPKSGLTWFNIIWIGVYHYCFIRVAMTIVAVVSHHYKRYCESSMSPYFSHVWVVAIECVAVAIAMYCVIQFYVQFKKELAYHKPGIKVVAIKLVIFLSFWQTTAISVGTSWFTIIHSSSKLQYPDISVGIPALLLSIEMFIFAIIHIFAYPWEPYRNGAPIVFYPKPSDDADDAHFGKESAQSPPSGGFLGIMAFVDAFNFWDVVKAFGRGMRWLFVGVKRRHEDVSYQKNAAGDIDMDGKDADTSHPLYPYRPRTGKSTDHLPIASEFRRSTYGMNQPHKGGRAHLGPTPEEGNEEGAGLIANAADHPSSRPPYNHLSHEFEAEPYESDLGYRGAISPQRFASPGPITYPASLQHSHQPPPPPGHALSTDEYYQVPSPTTRYPGVASSIYPDQGDLPSPALRHPGVASSIYPQDSVSVYSTQNLVGAHHQPSSDARDDAQRTVGQALWGDNPHQHKNGPMI